MRLVLARDLGDRIEIVVDPALRSSARKAAVAALNPDGNGHVSFVETAPLRATFRSERAFRKQRRDQVQAMKRSAKKRILATLKTGAAAEARQRRTPDILASDETI